MKDRYDNISDELLAAFLDGNTTREETEQVLEAILRNNELKEVFDVNKRIISNNDEHEINIDPTNPIIIGGLGIITGGIGKQLLHREINLVAANNNLEEINNMHNLEMETIGDIKYISHFYSDNYIEANKIYGLEARNIEFDPNVYQYESDTCAIRSQELVLRDYGIFVPQEDLKNIAIQHGWYSEGGTPFEAVGNLLDHYNIPNHRIVNANIFNIADELAQGHRIIVGVDLNELEGNSFWQTIKEFFVGDTPNHAMIVSGLNTSDPDNIKVILTDPGTGKALFECPQERFIAAWEDSRCFMVATNQPAPLAYNGATMIGFDYEKGHIAAIGNIDYDQFHNEIVLNADKYLPYLNSLDEYINNLEMNITTDWSYPELYNQLDDLTHSVHDEYIKLKMQELAGVVLDHPEPDGKYDQDNIEEDIDELLDDFDF